MAVGLALLGLLMVLAACAGGSDRSPAVLALSTSVAGTATARAAEAAASKTALVATSEAQVSQHEGSGVATVAAQAGQDEAAQAATATAVAPMLAELATYGVDPAQGQPAWLHPPATLEVQGFQQYDYINRFLTVVARDFVVATDITWNTRFGDSGCGLVLRSDGNEESLNQYLVIATRAANGHVVFATMENGQVTGGEDMYARGIDPLFTSANDTTNRLAVVGQGGVFKVYTNGTQVGQVVDDKFARGFVALVALNHSGHTRCEFTNTWLWLFNQ